MKQKTITKCLLLWRAFPYSQTILIVIGLILMVIGLDLEANSQDGGFFLVIGMLMVAGNGIVFIIRIFDILDKLASLNKQEQMLGFNFNEEMKRNNVTSVKFESPDWYIVVENSYHPLKRVVFIALKKEFIKSLSKKERITESFSYKKPPFFPPYDGIKEMLMIEMIDGTKQKIIAYEGSRVIDIFEVWYRRIDYRAQLPPRKKKYGKSKSKRNR